jgi:hypothetical protein
MRKRTRGANAAGRPLRLTQPAGSTDVNWILEELAKVGSEWSIKSGTRTEINHAANQNN